jgi:Bacterial nucleoid DNA-binding protein
LKTKEFILELASRLNKSQQDTTQMLEVFVSEVVKELEEGKSLNIQEFGTFEIKKKAERISVNPTTQQRMLVPPRLALAFRPHNKLKEKFK